MPRLFLQYLVYFSLYPFYTAVDRCFCHRQRHRYFYDRLAFNSHIEHRPLVICKVAHLSEILTLRLCELALDVYKSHSFFKVATNIVKTTASNRIMRFAILYFRLSSEYISLANGVISRPFSISVFTYA